MNRVVLFIFAVLLAVLPLESRALTILVPTDAQYAPLEIKSQVIDVRIDGPVARTHLKQVFHNPYNRQLEGTFLVPLPKDAQVTDFSMVINGQEVHATALEREQAREIYTGIVRRMQDPGLLEYIDAQTFSMRVFPIPARGDMPIELSFAQPIRREGEMYAFNFADGGPKRFVPVLETDFQLSIHWDEPLGTVYSPTHIVDWSPSKDGKHIDVVVPDYVPGADHGFTLLFAPEGEGLNMHMVAYRPEADEDGTFMLMITPPAEGALAKPVPKNVTFVLDVSGSMNEGGKIGKACDALVQCLGALGPEDTFNLITFSTGVETFHREPIAATPENIKKANEFISSIRARGGTNIEAALSKAIEQNTGTGLHQIVFLTDGLPTVGVTEPSQILRRLESMNENGLRVFSLGVGYDVNTHLLDAIASDTRAVSAYITPDEDIEVKVSGFFDSVAYPVLTDLNLSIPKVEIHDIYPAKLPDLFRGQNLLVFGRYKGHGPTTVTLAGLVGDQPYQEVLETNFPKETDTKTSTIEALWANRKVGYLLEEIRRHGEDRELREEVIALGEEFNLITPYTSYLAVEDSELDGRRGRDDFARVQPQAMTPMPLYELNSAPDVFAPNGGASAFAAPPPAASNDWAMQKSTAQSAPPPRSASSSTHALRAQSGEESVAAARELQERKSAETLSSVKDQNIQVRVKKIHRRTFELIGDTWIEKTSFEGKKTLEVKYLSEAHTKLIEQYPELKKALSLGERITLILNDFKVVIGPEGIEKSTDLPKPLQKGETGGK